jgi:hypothetical protein
VVTPGSRTARRWNSAGPHLRHSSEKHFSGHGAPRIFVRVEQVPRQTVVWISIHTSKQAG